MVEVFSNTDSILTFTVLNSSVPYYKLSQEKLQTLAANDVGEGLKYLPGTYIKDYGGNGGIKTISYRSLGASHTGVETNGVVYPVTQTAVVNLSQFDVFGVSEVSFSSGQPQSLFSTATAYTKANILSIQSHLFEENESNTFIQLYGHWSSIHDYRMGGLVNQSLGKKWKFGMRSLYQFGSGVFPFSISNGDSTYTSTRQNSSQNNFQTQLAFLYHQKHWSIYTEGNFQKWQQELPGAVILYNPFNNQQLNTQFSKIHSQFKYQKGPWNIGANAYFLNHDLTYTDSLYLNQDGYLSNTYVNQSMGGGFIFNRLINHSHQRLFFSSDIRQSTLTGSQFDLLPQRLNINSVLGWVKWFGRLKTEGNLSHQYIFDQQIDSQVIHSQFSPFVALAYLPEKLKNFRIRSHYKHTFRLPSFNDLYYNSIGNKELKPEKASQINLGMTYGSNNKRWRYELTMDGYWAKIQDKIVAIPTKDLFNWSMQNIGLTQSLGAELNGFLSWTKNQWTIQINSGQSFNQSIDITDVNSSTYGDQIPYTPIYSANYSLSIQRKNTQLISTLLTVGKRYTLNENIVYNELVAYSDFSLGLRQKLTIKSTQQLFIYLQIANVLNNNYQVIKSYPMPGRYLKVKLNYTFNK